MISTSAFIRFWLPVDAAYQEKNEKEQVHDSHEQSYRNPFFEVCINQQMFEGIATIQGPLALALLG
jgi:hypothetical protein